MKKKARAGARKRAAGKSTRKGAKKRVSAIPVGMSTVTPYLVVRNGSDAIDFYKRAFGAREVGRMPGPDGKIMHAALRIGGAAVFLADENPQMGSRSPQSLGGASGSLHLYVPNVDAAFKRAVDAGAQVGMPVTDMFWGDRYGKVTDPFGHEWGLATHKEDLTSAQVKKRAEAFFKQAGQHG
jgi:PhnB protein